MRKVRHFFAFLTCELEIKSLINTATVPEGDEEEGEGYRNLHGVWRVEVGSGGRCDGASYRMRSIREGVGRGEGGGRRGGVLEWGGGEGGGNRGRGMTGRALFGGNKANGIQNNKWRLNEFS